MQEIAQDELILPGHDLTGLVMPGRIDHQEIDTEGVGEEGLVLQLRAGFGDGCVLGVVNSRRGTRVLRVNSQPSSSGPDSTMN